MKKSFILSVLALAIASPVLARDTKTHNDDSYNTDAILHVWSWNFPEITKNMSKIADAGFTMLQTSPVQPCFQPEGAGKKLFDEKEGNWYYYYQPIDWAVGNYILGSKEQMQEMLDSAAKYNIRVLVDVLPNHTAFDINAVTDKFYEAVGGRDKMFHSQGMNTVQDYNDRYQCTLWASGGLPDVNTENPLFQKYFMEFVNELLGMGVGGFRYDTAKHIGVHSDPVDTASGVVENDFWDVATGRKSVMGVSLAVPYDSLFVYGEVLQDKNVPEEEYAEYFGQTASSYGWVLREALEKGSAKGIDLKNWHHSVAPELLTTWVESHDTYANAHESAHLTDDQIRAGWVFLTARQNGTPLFFSRPAGSTREAYWGNNVLGAAGNDEFFNPEVKAVNQFRKCMNGEKEDIQQNENGSVLLVNRGNKGAAIVNISNEPQTFALPTGLPCGEYSDVVFGKTFKVNNGVLSGEAGPLQTYILAICNQGGVKSCAKADCPKEKVCKDKCAKADCPKEKACKDKCSKADCPKEKACKDKCSKADCPKEKACKDKCAKADCLKDKKAKKNKKNNKK